VEGFRHVFVLNSVEEVEAVTDRNEFRSGNDRTGESTDRWILSGTCMVVRTNCRIYSHSWGYEFTVATGAPSLESGPILLASGRAEGRSLSATWLIVDQEFSMACGSFGT